MQRDGVGVMADGTRVAVAAVAHAARAQLDRGRARRALDAGRPRGGSQQAQLGRAIDRGRAPVREDLEDGVEVVDLELARHVRARLRPICPGARTTCAAARGEQACNCGPSPVVAGSAVASQKRSSNGRSGSAAPSSRRSGPVAAPIAASDPPERRAFIREIDVMA